MILRWKAGVAMEEKQLLIFRMGTEKYGIPVNEVSGIISNVGMHGLSILGNLEGSIHLQGNQIQNSDMGVGFKAGKKKQAIIANTNGVQILLIVDEVIQEKKVIRHPSELKATVDSLQIWKFKQE